MLNYMQAEIGKTLKRKYFWITIIVTLTCAFLGCLGFIKMNAYGLNQERLAIEHFIEIGTMIFPAATFMLIVFVDMITMEEYKNNTIKNIASSGLARVKIYMSKNIEIILVAIIAFVIILGGAIAMAYVMLGANNPETLQLSLEKLLFCSACSIFIWMGALSMLHFIASFIKNGTAASLLYVALILFFDQILGLLARLVHPFFNEINKVWIMTQLESIVSCSEGSSEVLIQSILVGLGYIILFGGLGSYLFRKADL